MVKVGFKNTPQILADLDSFENQLTREHVKYFNKVIPRDFRDYNKAVFESEGTKGKHGKWQKINSKYAKYKRRHFPGKTLLRRTDKMYKSLTSGTSDTIQFISNTRRGLVIRLGTKVKYAEYHQTGAGRLPVRRAIDPSRRLMIRWLKLIHRAYVYAARYGPFKKGWQIKFPSWDSIKM